MEKTHRIALVSAGLLIGAQVGLAALTTGMPESDSQESATAELLAPEATSVEVAEAASEATTPEGSAPDSIAAAESVPPMIPGHVQFDSLPSPWEGRPMLPSLAAYLEQTEHLRVTGAPGNVFPPGDEVSPLPSLTAYLERREMTLIAQTQPQVVSEPSASVAIAISPPEASGPVTGSASNASPSF